MYQENRTSLYYQDSTCIDTTYTIGDTTYFCDYSYNRQYSVKRVNNGLPDHGVLSLLQTTNGDIYVGTREGGLAKFADNLWTVYDTSNSGLPANNVRSLLQSANNDIYIGTYGGGLAKFDGSSWVVYNSSNSDLPNDNIYSLFQKSNGDIYVGTYGGGLAKFDGTNWTIYNSSNSGLPNNNVLTLLESTSGDIYVGTDGGGLAKFDGTNWTIYNSSNSGLNHDEVHSLNLADNGDIYIGSRDRTSIFDGVNWHYFDNYSTSNYLSSFLESMNGNIYAGYYATWEMAEPYLGVYIGEQLIKYTSYNSPLPTNLITSLEQIPNGDIYIGTCAWGDWGGLAIYHGEKNLLTELPEKSLLKVQNNTSITPNPFTNATTIRFSNPNNDKYLLQVFDLASKLVATVNGIITNEVLFKRNELESGIYLYKLTNLNENKIYTGKLLVE